MNYIPDWSEREEPKDTLLECGCKGRCRCDEYDEKDC